MSRGDLIGRTFPPFRFPVEAGKVIEFATAVLADNPVHVDSAAARDAGYADVVAPPTFSAVASHWSPSGEEYALELDLRRVLAAGAEWDYHRDVVAGDVLTVTGEIVSVEHKRGRRGGMTLITRENRFVNQRGELTMTVRSTVFELDHAPADTASEREQL